MTTGPTDPLPRLVVVTGPPASGKTTAARAVADALGWPLYTKEGFKELLFDTIGTGDLHWSARLGAASMELLSLVRLAGGAERAVPSRVRHPGHLDEVREIDPGKYRPLPLDGPLIRYRIGDDVVREVLRCVS